MSDQNPYLPPPSGSSPSQQPSPYGEPPPPQPYPQQGYQQYPAYQQGYPAGGDERPTSSLAVVGFIVSLVGLILPVSLIGFILSLIALPGTGRGKKKGRGFAVAGAIIGGIVTLLSTVFIIFLVVLFSQADQDGDGDVSDQEIEDWVEDWLGVETASTDGDLDDLVATEAAGPAAVPADPAALVVAG